MRYRRSLCDCISGIVLLAACLCPLLASHAGEDGQADLARQILAASGVHGGLVVHLGCGDGQLTAALGAGNAYLVHGLDAEAANVEAARAQVRSAGLYGKVAIDRLADNRLPYIDNLVNLIVASRSCDVRREEIVRVLAPGGVALVSDDDDATFGVPESEAQVGRVRVGQATWTRVVKALPANIDQWTHYLHGPDNNAVAHDTLVASPFHVQWVGGPKWARHHNHLSSTSAMVTAGGRLFAIVDEGPIASMALPPQWHLVARDAFSGVVLWKKPVGPWEGALRPFRSGPTELARRLVATGDRVYVTLGYGQPAAELDASSGQVLRTFDDTDGALELIHDADALFVVAGTMQTERKATALRRGGAHLAPRNKRLVAVDASTGKSRWKKADADTVELLPTTLCTSGERIFFQNPTSVVCLDAASGRLVWKAARPSPRQRASWSAPTLVAHHGVVLSADCAVRDAASSAEDPIQWSVTSKPRTDAASTGELIAFSADDGRELWRTQAGQGYNAPADVFVADGLVWASTVPGRNTVDFTEGRDLQTGEVKRRLKTDAAFTETHHHRCYRDKATDRFILLGRTGVELIDLNGAKPLRHCWVRGACQYGVMPANGLLYAPPHACACYIQSKLSGLWALASERKTKDEERSAKHEGRLEQGPAFGDQAFRPSSAPLQPLDDWPTYRHDRGRTGRTEMRVSPKLDRIWRTPLGGRLTSPVVAGGKLLVAAVDGHQIHALDAQNGKPTWSFTTGGRIDSPPTVEQGRAVFGCADGFVYCLRLADGALVWRFQAAPRDRRTVAFGQVESVWPATGSVLVRDGVVYATAGRSSYLDGGMALVRLDLATGKLLGQTRFYNRDPKTGDEPEAIIEDVELPGALPDVLVDDGQYIYLRDKVLDAQGVEQSRYVPHLYSSAGLLDDTWWHRTYWLWGERTWGRASGWHVMPGIRPSGRILVTDASTVFGYGRKVVRGNSLQGYHLFRADKQVETVDRTIKNNNVALMKYQRPAKVRYYWSRELPLVARALLLADDVLFAAGPVMKSGGPGVAEPTFEAASPAAIMAFGAADGQPLGRCDLAAQPVFDGMAAACGNLYLATVDGSVVCLGDR